MGENHVEAMLVQQMIDGDVHAFDQLYEQYKKMIYHSARYLTGNEKDAEDLMQETFLKVYQYRHQIKEPAYFKTWIFCILNRTAWRKLKKIRRELPGDELKAQHIVDFLPEEQPELLAISNEEKSIIRQAIDRLPYHQRMTVILYYFNELSVAQIAKSMSCREGTVKSRLFQARKRLKEEMSDGR